MGTLEALCAQGVNLTELHVAHTFITGKLEDLAPISQRLVKLSLADSTTGGTLSDLPGLFPSLKHLHVETQEVRGRRWSLPQTPDELAAEEELNLLLERDSAAKQAAGGAGAAGAEGVANGGAKGGAKGKAAGGAARRLNMSGSPSASP